MTQVRVYGTARKTVKLCQFSLLVFVIIIYALCWRLYFCSLSVSVMFVSKINLPVCNSETTAFKVSGTKTTVCHVTIPTNIFQVEYTILFLTPNFVLMLQIERKSDDTTTVAKCFHFVVVCSVLLMCVWLLQVLWSRVWRGMTRTTCWLRWPMENSSSSATQTLHTSTNIFFLGPYTSVTPREFPYLVDVIEQHCRWLLCFVMPVTVHVETHVCRNPLCLAIRFVFLSPSSSVPPCPIPSILLLVSYFFTLTLFLVFLPWWMKIHETL